MEIKQINNLTEWELWKVERSKGIYINEVPKEFPCLAIMVSWDSRQRKDYSQVGFIYFISEPHDSLDIERAEKEYQYSDV